MRQIASTLQFIAKVATLGRRKRQVSWRSTKHHVPSDRLTTQEVLFECESVARRFVRFIRRTPHMARYVMLPPFWPIVDRSGE